MGIFSKDDSSTDGDSGSRSSSKTTKDVAVTGRARDLNLTDAEREQGRVTDRAIRQAEARRQE
jgi:hypothetical protein